jgi:Zn-finger nucleic acid-binding protein
MILEKQLAEQSKDTICLVFCPNCEDATNAVSFNLLKRSDRAFVDCPRCGGITMVRYDGEDVFFERA